VTEEHIQQEIMRELKRVLPEEVRREGVRWQNF
jgi:hypothetical protein